MSSPAMQFYVKDWLISTRSISVAARGAYFDLLCWSWDNGPIPKSDKGKAGIVGVSEAQFKRLWAEFSLKWQETAVGLINLRLERQREELLAYRRRQAEAGRASARRRSLNTGSTTVEPPLDSGCPSGSNQTPNQKATLHTASASSKKIKISGERKERVTAPTGRLLRLFNDLHRDRIGTNASIHGGKDGKLLKDLWLGQEQDTDLVERVMRRFFDTKDPFVIEAGFTVGVFSSQFGKMLSQESRQVRVECLADELEAMCDRAGINNWEKSTWFIGARLENGVLKVPDADAAAYVQRNYAGRLGVRVEAA